MTVQLDQQHAGMTALEVCREVLQRLEEWAQPYGTTFDSRRFSAMVQAAYCSMPEASVDRLALTARFPIWVYAIDDRLDSPDITDDELETLVAACRGAVDGASCIGSDPLVSTLAELRSELMRSPLFEHLRAPWELALHQMLIGMRFECYAGRQLAMGLSTPSLEEYLVHAAHSIAVPAHVLTTWIVTEDASLPEHLDELMKALHEAASAIRLANDLRTVDKEVAEENLNALMLGLTQTELVDRLQGHSNSCQTILSPMLGLSEAARCLARTLAFSLEFYQCANP